MKPRILLTGKRGQVGAELERSLLNSSELLALGRGELDLAHPDNIRKAIQEFHPHAIVNAAAYTAVDLAESDENAAYAINAEAPRVIAEEAKKIDAAVIHYSTDYVFDGSKTSPYTETDPVNPINAYGRTKLMGERAIESAGGRYVILRTSWVYGTRGRNFLLTILRLAAQRQELRIVADQTGAPTCSRDIAAATARILADEWQRSRGVAPFSTSSGIYHMTAGGETNWCEFATAILNEGKEIPASAAWLASVTGGRPLIAERVLAIGTVEYPTPARRPGYSVLSNLKLAENFGIRMADWRAQLHSAVTETLP